MASRFLGFDRREGARVALLMSIPAILAAAGYTTLKLIAANLKDPSELDVEDQELSLANVDLDVLTNQAIFGAVLSCLAAYVALIFLMRWLRTATFTPFAVYRLVLGVLLLGLAYGGFLGSDTPAEASTTTETVVEAPAATE